MAPATNRPPRAIDKMMSGENPESAIACARSRDAAPNGSQARVSRSLSIARDPTGSGGEHVRRGGVIPGEPRRAAALGVARVKSLAPRDGDVAPPGRERGVQVVGQPAFPGGA